MTDTIERRYWTIPEIAKLLNVSDSKIRFWSEQFEIEPKGKKNFIKKFNREQLEKFELIKVLSDTGLYTLFGIRVKMGL